MKHPFDMEPYFGLAMRDGHPNVRGEVDIAPNSIEITLFAPDGKTSRASVYVEYYDGKVVAHVWDENDQENDPAQTVVIIPDPRQPPPD